jgi:hypothetical protein
MSIDSNKQGFTIYLMTSRAIYTRPCAAVPLAAVAANPALHGMRALDVMDRVVDALGAAGLMVGRCRFTVSNPVLKATVSALETEIS